MTDKADQGSETLVYKLLTDMEWKKFQQAGVFTGSQVDVEDGFIHFSTASQVGETARKHFSHLDELWLVTVEIERLDGELKWEPSRGGQLFPHLYSQLSIDAVTESRHLISIDGQFDIFNR